MDTGSLRDDATPQQEPRLWPRGLPSVHWDVQRASDEHTQRSEGESKSFRFSS